MTDVLKDYFDALDRLKRGKSLNLPAGTKINNDSVSIEAGRKKGTIKKARPVFNELIEAIAAAAKEEVKPPNDLRAQLNKSKAESAKYRKLWEEALAREVSLVKELWDARAEWDKERASMASDKITPINASKTKSSRR